MMNLEGRLVGDSHNVTWSVEGSDPSETKVQTSKEFRSAEMLAEDKNNLKWVLNGEGLSVVYDLVNR